MTPFVLAALLAAAPAPPPPAEDPGPMTRAEMEATNKARFEEMDADRDGFLSGAEMAAAIGPAKVAATLAALDADRDGKVSAAELSRQMLLAFDSADADHDGTLTLAERAAMRRGNGR
ncbi:MAG: EF-hand domain-containing protein [Alphaproteobacteria bacterium]|nr:EF-hand domain-containing protein [Alphaproteobacteria bacterium]MBV9372771.1 EF-hand domain-containing protein [Alphaproteobacteria bacterium]MBV9900222.1 EF-hand domain-containing protein [Alphaproteobacteria bacterium]